MVFGGVVQERRDRLVFAAAVVQHDRGDAHQMSNIGDGVRTGLRRA